MKNRSPTRFLGFKTPFEALYGFKPAVNHLRVFGSKAFSHVPKANRKKLDPKAVKCIFVGYGTKFKAYKLFDPSNHIVFASIDVIFHEQENECNKDNNYEKLHILFEVEDNNAKAREKNSEQQKHEEKYL